MTKQTSKIRDMVYIALFAVLIAVCSWISIPATVPFTMQTFGVFLTVSLLGGRRGTLAVVVYLLLGAVGAPVFAGFGGGVGTLLGTTGGYLLGFLFTALVMWAFEKVPGKHLWVLIASMVVGLILCYAFGTAWFVRVYAQKSGPVGVATALSWCVFPYIVPDLAKMALAVAVGGRLKRAVKL